MEDYCVCCGAPVPEGRMVCPICEREAEAEEGEKETVLAARRGQAR